MMERDSRSHIIIKLGGSCLLACACMAVSRTRSLAFIDDVTADKSNIRMNSEAYAALLSGQMLQNWLDRIPLYRAGK